MQGMHYPSNNLGRQNRKNVAPRNGNGNSLKEPFMPPGLVTKASNPSALESIWQSWEAVRVPAAPDVSTLIGTKKSFYKANKHDTGTFN